MQIYLEIVGVAQVRNINVGVLAAYSGLQMHGLLSRPGTAVYRSRQGLAHLCA